MIDPYIEMLVAEAENPPRKMDLFDQRSTAIIEAEHIKRDDFPIVLAALQVRILRQQLRLSHGR